ncbi:hypothetical protein [Branchiibius cervicis]|uniref:Uncharacterized protein n=1 Tax=Branchiibius cervicis TaxID=908252 RepID=A0ABW2AUX2_9MICO
MRTRRHTRGTRRLPQGVSAASGEPAASAINFSHTGAAIADGMTVAVSSARQIKVKASSPVHVIVDVTGVIG